MLTLSDVSVLCAFAAAAVGCFGAYSKSSAWPAVVGVAFTAVFWQTLRLCELRQTSLLTQGLLVLVLVMLSFALHLLFLPAGICCFFAMICVKNELLLPTPRRTKQA